MAVGGCGLAGASVDALIARDIASFGADYGISGLHEIKRSTIGADTFALLAGTAPEGRQSVGLSG